MAKVAGNKSQAMSHLGVYVHTNMQVALNSYKFQDVECYIRTLKWTILLCHRCFSNGGDFDEF